MQLPTRTKSIEALKSLGAPVKWDELFVNRSPFKLCYFLQILNWLLRDGDKFQSEPDWSTCFVENGGLDYLLSLLIVRDNSTNSVIKRACLCFALKAISYI